MESKKTILVEIKRQDHPEKASYWEKIEVPYAPNMNVISLLMYLQQHPKTTAPAWEAACLEEVCGTCSMIINGVPKQACSTLVDQLTQPIRLEPFSKFPVVRDLITDRSRMFDHLKKVKAWIDIDGSHDLGPGPKMSPAVALDRYKLSECMTCGCCLEACPQYGQHSDFIGPQAISQVRLFNLHPSGQMHEQERLQTLMTSGGITDCGDAQNCVKVCPKGIPLTESIAKVSAATTKLAFKSIFGGQS